MKLPSASPILRLVLLLTLLLRLTISAQAAVGIGQIGNFVWNDLNGNGIQDANEPGIPGVTVRIRTSTGALLNTATTDANGAFLFKSLPAGTYTVEVETSTGPLVGLVASPTGATTADKDSNGSLATVTLPFGNSTDFTIDFGFYAPSGSIGDFVWNDLNHNGMQDPPELGIPNVAVSLENASGVIIATTTTDAKGHYEFTGLTAGSYYVLVDPTSAPLAGLLASPTGKAAPDVDSNSSTVPVVLATNQSSDQTIDFGLYAAPTGSIGNFIWNDVDRDGVQGLNETGIDGVTVTLLDGNGQTVYDAYGLPVLPITTYSNGFYQFNGLFAGTYQVVVQTPPGMLPSLPDQGSADLDSNGSPATVILASDTSSDQTIDFGFHGPPMGQIGDFVWQDTNQNGVQDGGEPGISSLTVTLYSGNDVLATTMTDSTGHYLFQNLYSGTYTVKIGMPANMLPTFSPAGSDPTLDSNGSPATVTLPTSNSADLSIDFGFIPTPAGTIGDYVWRDLNGDGVQGSQADEPGIPGIEVDLYDATGALVQTTHTDSQGHYLFVGLSSGTYSVQVPATVMLEGYTYELTTPHAATADVDSNGSGDSVILQLNTSSDTTIDFGYRPLPASRIGNFVWNDSNFDGLQQSNEPGIDDVTVNLYFGTFPNNVIPPGTNPDRTTVTAGGGSYIFDKLNSGTYTVTVDSTGLTTAGYLVTSSNAGTDRTMDSNASPSVVTLASNTQDDLSIDFGFFQPSGQIGDFVWWDKNENGIQDAGDVGIPNVTVQLEELIGASYAVLGTTTTDANGKYLFAGLTQGTYRVTVLPTAALNGYVTTDLGSTDADHDSNPNPSIVVLSANDAIDLSIDFGYFQPTSAIGDFVWLDVNGNGIQDSGEPGISGMKVLLYAVQGSSLTYLATATTDSNGSYVFTDLPAGSYQVQVDIAHSPALKGLTPGPLGAADPTIDSNNPAGTNVIITPPAPDVTIDFGFVPPPTGCIGDFVWKDVNGNGIQEPGEAGINGVTVYLFKASDLSKPYMTQVTSGTGSKAGHYAFTGLMAGDYVVKVDDTDHYLFGLIPILAGATGSTAANDSNANPASVTLATNSSQDNTIDFGFSPPGCACIGDRVWRDLNCNGIQDCNEPGIPCVTVKLYWNNILIKTDITDTCGRYGFSGLWAGSYTVTIDNSQSALAGLVPTAVNASSSVSFDSNPNPATVVLTSNSACDSTIDFGYKTGPTPPCRGLVTCPPERWCMPPGSNDQCTMLNTCFNKVYPWGLCFGGRNCVWFTSCRSVQNFLPCHGTSGPFRQTCINPSTTLGDLTCQTVSLQLCVDFSNCGLTANGLAKCTIKTGKFSGQTVAQFLNTCESVLGGGPLPKGCSYDDLTSACTLVNHNYDQGADCGYLKP